ncbi:50S ribosomal protein L6 [SAR202 cluster bacterium AC-409-J13_OGT_754m]|nr:50S ribosomal protein L6 [SAR202 cluster bacterium AC-409-J13_OGT_754m]
MSRIGRKLIVVPGGVKVSIKDNLLTASGPKGEVVQSVHAEVNVKIDEQTISVTRLSANKFHRSLHGLTRTLIANAVTGVSEGYQKTLELMGVGYRVQQDGEGVILNVGYSHPVQVATMEGVSITVEGNNRVHVAGCDKQKVGQIAAQIRKVRPPNAYKEKGIKYSDEIIKLKPGKAAARSA